VPEVVEINISHLYVGRAKLKDIDTYIQKVLSLAGEGNNVVLTGAGPVWLYLKLAHALHGKVRNLTYRSPVSRDVEIFDHSPF
jgi:hypothetical protein